MPLLNQATIQTYSMHGVTFTAYANSATGAAQLAGWCADFAPGTSGQRHRVSAEELLHVLEGRLEIQIDHDVFEASAGETVLVPAGAAFRVSNAADVPARAWVVTTLGLTATMEDSDGTTLAPPWAQ